MAAGCISASTWSRWRRSARRSSACWACAASSLFYLSAGIVAGFVHVLLFSDSVDPVIGASGAISGVFGAVLMLMRYAGNLPSLLPIAGIWIALNVFFGLFGGMPGAGGEQVAWAAHIGGFVYGLAGHPPSSRRAPLSRREGAMADQPVPLRRYLAANAVALAPSFAALLVLYWSGHLAGRPALIAMAGIAVVTVFLVQRYLGSLARFARFVGELSDEREPVMPRLSFAPATEELATAAATLSAGWRRQRASIDNLAASAQAIVDGLPDPLIAVDRQRRIVRTNLAARALLGAVGAERDLSTTLRHAAAAGRHRRRCSTTGPTAISPGPTRPPSSSCCPGPPELDMIAHLRRLPRAAADGSLALIVLHDTTALRRAERMRADFVANASHELKTPIAGLAGFIETLRGPARDDAAARERFLGIMAEQADRMRRLVDDLLMLSRIEQHEHARPDARGRYRPACCAACSTCCSSRPSSRKVALELGVDPATCRARSATTTSSPSCSRTWSTTR